MSYQKFTKDVGIIGLTNLIMTLKGLIILPILTKKLGVENYGIWAQIMVTVSLVTPIATLGLPLSLVRFLAAQKNKREIQEGIYSVLTVIFAVALIVAVVLFLFSKPISEFFESEQILVKILASIILFECLNLSLLNAFRAFQEIKKYSFFIIFQTFGGLGLIIAAISFGYGLFGAILSFLIIRLVNFLLMAGFIVKKFGVKIPNFSRIKEYLYYSLPTIPGNISYWITQSSDRYLIGFFLGTLFVGYYAPAYTMGLIMSFFITPLSFVLPAVLSKTYDENKVREVKVYLEYSLKYFLMIAIPSVFGLSILAKQLLTIFSTTEIAEKSYSIVPFVALSMLLFGICSIVAQIITFKKKTKIVGAIWIGTGLLNLGLNFIFIPHLGILGAAITTLTAYFFAFALTWYYSFREFQFEIDWKFIFKSVLASIFMSLGIFWFSPVGLGQTVIAISLGAILYGTLLFLFKGFAKKELEFLKGFFKKPNF